MPIDPVARTSSVSLQQQQSALPTAITIEEKHDRRGHTIATIELSSNHSIHPRTTRRHECGSCARLAAPNIPSCCRQHQHQPSLTRPWQHNRSSPLSLSSVSGYDILESYCRNTKQHPESTASSQPSPSSSPYSAREPDCGDGIPRKLLSEKKDGGCYGGTQA